MAIVFVGGESDSFQFLAGVLQNTSGYFDANYSRGAVNSLVEFYAYADGGPYPELWFHVYHADSQQPTNGRVFLQLEDSSGQGIVRLVGTATINVLQFQYWDGASWQNISTPFTFPVNTFRTIDIHCKIDPVVGEFIFYGNGIAQASLTGNTDFFGCTGVNRARLQSLSSSSTAGASGFSQCCMSTVNSTSYKISTIAPNAAGSTAGWTGAYTDIDEVTNSDADFISSAAANQVSTFGLTNLSATAAALQVVAVGVAVRVRRGAIGPQNIQAAIRTNGVDYYSSNIDGLTGNFNGGRSKTWDLNPDTGALWTAAEVNALEAGVKSIA